MAAHNELGRWGEDVAADYLRRKGYTIMERDWHSGHRDIDLVAWDGEMVVFVEVKTRRNRAFTDPEHSVDHRKLYNLRQAIDHYVKYRRVDGAVRLDVITVTGLPGSEPDILHIEDFQW